MINTMYETDYSIGSIVNIIETRFLSTEQLTKLLESARDCWEEEVTIELCEGDFGDE